MGCICWWTRIRARRYGTHGPYPSIFFQKSIGHWSMHLKEKLKNSEFFIVRIKDIIRMYRDLIQ